MILYREWEIVDGLPVLTYEEWAVEGKNHRVDGPAWRRWKIAETSIVVLVGEQWYLQGKEVNPLASPFVQALTTDHLQACGLLIWPGLMNLILGYAV